MINPEMLEARRQEIAAYQLNIVTYTAIAETTPSEWPANLLEYKTANNRHEVIGRIEDFTEVELLADLWAHDDAIKAIRTETLEMRKAMAILTAWESQTK